MKYWDYEDYDGSLEDAIQRLVERGKIIKCVTVLKYATIKNKTNQDYLFPIRALVIYS